VSHDLEAVKQHCERTLLLNRGVQVMIGKTDEVVGRYEGVV
jgi:ABC-type polysaccharide/polyol phosphate transport system ATPase subunit